MSFISTVILLVGVVAGVLVPIWIGHALSVQSLPYAIRALGALAVAVVCVLLHTRLVGRSQTEADTAH
jgi:hypothetical protein